ncbi:MAG TPA: FGGY family carbohydrate kinase [Vicinamibacterales bacterium]|nr:FGGY family carbohydrate kinase [Vicinamibacterales bacterium]
MLYAGLDCSTQSLSVVVIDADRRAVVFRDALTFAEPFQPSEEPGVVHARPAIWAAALETMLGRMARGIDRTSLRAISGSAQQHGSVYCGASPQALTRATSPIWMDSSTARECAEIESALGGPQVLAELTGSRAVARFTGPQIRKFAREAPGAYARTARIHLVSSYLASLLIGRHGPIDHADGSGMNLMDLRSRTWSSRAINATAPDLTGKLPPLVASSAAVGKLAGDWQSRFGLPAAQVVAWSGDNPNSLVGTGLIHEGELAVSLGTSDTIFGPMSEPRVSSEATGHVFVSPTGDYMGITVFRNGSLARERIRDQFGLDWNGFSAALAATDAGNGGAAMLPWFEPEITPPVPRPAVVCDGLEGAPPERYVRAVVEAQMFAIARHSEWMGVTPRRIYATGGAAANREILQVLADVCGADVHRFESQDSAALGAALRAWQADTGLAWADIVADFARPPPGSLVPPLEANVTLYRSLRARYIALERAARAG